LTIAVDFLKRVNDSEDGVKRDSYAVFFFVFGLMVLVASAAFAQQPPAQQLPANVAGKWTLYCKDPNGTTSAKYLDLQQEGSVIKGHFKGSNKDPERADVSREGRGTPRSGRGSGQHVQRHLPRSRGHRIVPGAAIELRVVTEGAIAFTGVDSYLSSDVPNSQLARALLHLLLFPPGSV
jgi:hypothetical protein